jgi:hypothetical protein
MRSRLALLALVVGGAPTLACWSTARPGTSGTGTGSGGTGGAAAPVPIPGDVGSVTTCAGTQATYYQPADLPATQSLPDPFLAMDGTRITKASQWACRRDEIGGQAMEYELGPKPGKPVTVTGSFDGATITVTASDGKTTISFGAPVTFPSTGSPPYPAMIGIGGISIAPAQLNALGVATINFPNDALGVQVNGGSRGQGSFYDLYGHSHPAGAMIAWAWGVSRLIDALESTPAANIDPKRLGVTGCSRNGKGALIAGAFDDRIALTIPQESGSGGSASWRVSDAQAKAGTMVQTLSEIVGENVWFRSSFMNFAATATKLPFDHHMIEGMIAPRALLIIENTSQVWLGNVSTYTDSMAAHAIWQALGIPDHMGVSQVDSGGHCVGFGSQQPEVTAYVQKFLIGGGTASTAVLRTDGGYAFDQATWAPWDVPAL